MHPSQELHAIRIRIAIDGCWKRSLRGANPAEAGTVAAQRPCKCLQLRMLADRLSKQHLGQPSRACSSGLVRTSTWYTYYVLFPFTNQANASQRFSEFSLTSLETWGSRLSLHLVDNSQRPNLPFILRADSILHLPTGCRFLTTHLVRQPETGG